jgi:hypothetical protein
MHSPQLGLRDFSRFFFRYSYPEASLLIRGRHLEAFFLAEQVRRLRRDSQPRPGRPRVIVRANYVGLPSMAGRGTDEGGESRRIMGETPVQSPEVRSRSPKSPRWSAGRRARRLQDARRASSARKCCCAARRSAPPLWGTRKKRQASRRLSKTRAGGALSCSVVIAGLDPAIHLSCKRMDARVEPGMTKERKTCAV